MSPFLAKCFNPKTKLTTESDVDTLDEAKIRARTLRGVVEPFEEQAACVLTITGPRNKSFTFAPTGWVENKKPTAKKKVKP